MTDTTPARRALLALLLDRVDRDALLEPEKPLLRCLVATEQHAADARESVMERSYVERADRAEGTVYRLRQAVREASVAALLGGELAGFVEQMQAILDTASLPDDGPSADDDGRRGTRRERVTAALLTEHYRRARERIVASPEEHSAAMAAVVLDAIDGQTTPDDDARPWIADAFGLDIETSWGVIADTARSHLHHLAAANDAIARVRELAERWAYVPGLKDSPRTSLLRALDGPSPAPDDAQAAADRAVLDNAIADDIARRAVEGGNTGQMIGLVGLGVATPVVTDDASDVEIIAANDIPTDWARGTESRCPARYTGPPPGIDVKWGARSDYQCDLRVHSRGTDHAARLGSGPFSWTDDIAVWPTDNAPSEPQP